VFSSGARCPRAAHKKRLARPAREKHNAQHSSQAEEHAFLCSSPCGAKEFKIYVKKSAMLMGWAKALSEEMMKLQKHARLILRPDNS
jgi:hypothetical protein